jgi:hypothetical protein
MQIFFAHRRLPMSKKILILCVLRVSVVKSNFLFTDSADKPSHRGRDISGQDNDLRILRRR